jgi:hypothetical protein
MDVTDYSAKLQETRNKYAKQAEDMLETYKQNQEHVEEMADNKAKTQQANYMKERQEIKDQFEKASERYSAEAQAQIEERTENYRKRNESQLQEFNRETNKTKLDYDKQLSNISDAFNKTVQSKSRAFQQKLDNAQSQFDERSTRAESASQDKVRQIDLQTQNSLAELQNENNKEKHKIIQDNVTEVQTVHRDNREKNSRIEDQRQEQFRSMKDAHEGTLSQLKKHQSDNVMRIKEWKENEVRDLKQNFQDLTDKMSEKNRQNNELERRETKDRILRMQSEHGRQLQTLRNTTKEKITGGSQLDVQKQKEQRIVDGYENRLRHLRKKMDEVQFATQEDKERINTMNQAQLTENDRAHNKEIEKKNKDMRDYKEKVVMKSQEEMQNTINTYKKELKSTKDSSIQQNISQQEKSKRMLSTQRQEFARNVIEMSDQNRLLVNDLQEQHAAEKTEFIQAQRKENYEQREDLKKELASTYSKREESVEKKLDYAIKENQQQRASYEQKISNLKNKSSEEIQNIRTLADDRRKADMKNFRQEFEGLQVQMQQELLRIKGEFQKQLGDTKTESDLQLAKLTQRYEGMLGRERSEAQRTLQSKMSSSRAEYDRLYKKSELEKATMKHQFEIQMQNVKQSIADREIERAKDANKDA